jgi:molecular chaperone GrpE
LEERLLRLQADFDNFRKRTQRERLEFGRRANEELMTELLPVLDHFELGLRNARQQGINDSVVEGFQLVYDQLLSALGKFHLAPIEADGRPFDPHVHEAVTHLPSEEHPPDTVMAETRRGYRLGERLLRATQVVVSSGPYSEEPSEPDEGSEGD